MAFLQGGIPDQESVKLPLFLVNPWQTYDLLVSRGLYPNVMTWLYTNDSILVPHLPWSTTFSPTGHGAGDLLFQRYNPYGYKWAQEYTTKLFNFLKTISWSWRYNPSSSTDSKWGKQLKNPDTSLRATYSEWQDLLEVELPNNNEVVTITYFYNNYDARLRQATADPETVKFAPVNRGFYSLIHNDCLKAGTGKEHNLASLKFVCRGQRITLDTKWLTIASLVVDSPDSGTIQAIEDQIPTHYQYSFLDTYLQINQDYILSEFPYRKVSTTTLHNLVTDFSMYQAPGDANSRIDMNYSVTRTEQEANFPDYYYFCSLYYGNNNYWGNDIDTGQDLGQELAVKFTPNSNVASIDFGSLSTQVINASRASLSAEIDLPTGFDVPEYIAGTVAGYKPGAIASIQVNTAAAGVTGSFFPYWINSTNRPNHLNSAGFKYFDQQLSKSFSSVNCHNAFHSIVSYFPRTDDTSDPYLYQKTQRYFVYKTPVLITYLQFFPLVKHYYQRVQWVVDRPYLRHHKVFWIERVWTQIVDYGVAERNETRIDTYELIAQGQFSGIITIPSQSTSVVPDLPPPPISHEPLQFLNSETIPNTETQGYFPVHRATAFSPFSNYAWDTFSADYSDTFSFETGYFFWEDGFPCKLWQSNNDTYLIILDRHQDCAMLCPDLEDLKKQVDEIHKALEAGKYAYLDGSDEEPRVANLGYYVERIARILGISVNSNGSIRSIRESAWIPQGDPLPAGWTVGQWSRNNGGSSEGQRGGNANEQRDGLAYDVRSNKFTLDQFSGAPTQIVEGGYALVENIPQLLEIIMSDLDKAIGLGDASVNVIPSPDGRTIAEYQGLNQVLTDIAFMLSQLSRNIQGGHISSLLNQALLQELLSALGLPVSYKELEIGVDSEGSAKIPYPAIAPGSPTLIDYYVWILENIGLLIGNQIQPVIEEEEDQDNAE